MDENNYGVSLDDIDYTAPPPKKSVPTDVSAPVLDDMDYYTPPPTVKKGAPTGVSAPVLDDMDYYTPPPSQKKGAPTGVSAPVLDDDDMPYQAKKPEVKIMTDEEIIAKFTPEQLETYNRLPDVNKQKVLERMREQLGVEAPPEPPVEVSAPILDEDNYTPPPKPEKKAEPQIQTPVSAPILDDEPETPVYKPKFVDEDLEKAKREGAKKAVSSQLVSDQKDSKESLRMMLELKKERQRELAQQGFKWVIMLAVIGLIGAVSFYLLYSGSLGLDYKDGIDGIAGVIKDSALYITLAMGASGLAIISGIGFFKSIASFVYVVSAIVQVFPGAVMIPQHEGSMGLTVILYAVSIICTIAVVFGLSGVESVSLYFKRNEL